MKKILIIILFISQLALSQSDDSMDRKNAFTFEVFGHSESLISVNYERIFNSNFEKLFYTCRIGVGYFPGGEKNDNYATIPSITTIPVVFSLLYGNKHFIQLGIGYTALFSQDYVNPRYSKTVFKKFESDFSISIGYRLMTRYGLVVQAYPIAAFKDNPEKKFTLFFGIGLGYSW